MPCSYTSGERCGVEHAVALLQLGTVCCGRAQTGVCWRTLVSTPTPKTIWFLQWRTWWQHWRKWGYRRDGQHTMHHSCTQQTSPATNKRCDGFVLWFLRSRVQHNLIIFVISCNSLSNRGQHRAATFSSGAYQPVIKQATRWEPEKPAWFRKTHNRCCIRPAARMDSIPRQKRWHRPANWPETILIQRMMARGAPRAGICTSRAQQLRSLSLAHTIHTSGTRSGTFVSASPAPPTPASASHTSPRTAACGFMEASSLWDQL